MLDNFPKDAVSRFSEPLAAVEEEVQARLGPCMRKATKREALQFRNLAGYLILPTATTHCSRYGLHAPDCNSSQVHQGESRM